MATHLDTVTFHPGTRIFTTCQAISSFRQIQNPAFKIEFENTQTRLGN